MAPEPATQRFVWPPRRADSGADQQSLAVAVPDSSKPATASRAARVLAEPGPSLIASFERTWLGLATPPLPIRLASWSPDKPSAYCPRCGTSCGPFESTLAGCPTCSARKLPWERLIRLSEHRGTIRDMIHEVKFTRWRRLGDQLGQLLGESINAEITRAGLRASDFTLIPIPSSFLRRIARGIDH